MTSARNNPDLSEVIAERFGVDAVPLEPDAWRPEVGSIEDYAENLRRNAPTTAGVHACGVAIIGVIVEQRWDTLEVILHRVRQALIAIDRVAAERKAAGR